ncbi:MAG TPA: hypothetical protein VF183_12970 [Acidimicrobiales bacterium]
MRRIVVVGLVGGVVVVTAVALTRRRSAPIVLSRPDWSPLALTGPVPATVAEPGGQPALVSPEPATAPAPDTATPPWVDALEGGACPLSHPVKASASGIYHVPGGRFYDTTRARRCYLDAQAAEADGLRPSKR